MAAERPFGLAPAASEGGRRLGDWRSRLAAAGGILAESKPSQLGAARSPSECLEGPCLRSGACGERILGATAC